MGEPHRIGIVGAGWISGAYLETLREHPAVSIAAVADLDTARASAFAARVPGCRALSVADLLRDDSIGTVLNLTIPAAHAEIGLATIKNGRRLYGEKPLTADLETARTLMSLAADRGIAVGCAPDTVLGTGIQTARAAVDSGMIGRPMSALAVMATAGPERWHHQPDFYYRAGGGPLLDMGPYYLTALIHLLGPIAAVTGAAARQRSWRVIGSGPRAGEQIPVSVDTHVTGVLHHAGGAVSTITTSFDAVRTTAVPIEVHGETGTIAAPDPNNFDGDVRFYPLGGSDWQTLEPSAGYAGAGRGIGLLDMLTSPPSDPSPQPSPHPSPRPSPRPSTQPSTQPSPRSSPRAGGVLALHVLDAMTSLLRSAEEGRRIELTTTAERPLPVPLTHL